MAVFVAKKKKKRDIQGKEGVMIKLNNLGITGRMFNWVKDFLFGRATVFKLELF